MRLVVFLAERPCRLLHVLLFERRGEAGWIRVGRRGPAVRSACLPQRFWSMLQRIVSSLGSLLLLEQSILLLEPYAGVGSA